MLLMTGLSFSNNQDFSIAKADNDANTLRISTNNEVYENTLYNASVYLNPSEEISALEVDVYFDENVFEVVSTYNSISANIYDSSMYLDHIKYTYVFNTLNLNRDSKLFYFYYRIKEGTPIGSYGFDIIVNDAYNSALETVEVTSYKSYVNLIEKNTGTKIAIVNLSGLSYVRTSYENTFDVSYVMSSNEVAGGTLIIHYDDTLLNVENIVFGNYFDEKIYDYNIDTSGEIYVSFIASAKTYATSLFTITFKVIKNVTTNSNITVSTTNLYDFDLNEMNFDASVLRVYLAYDSSYDETPKMMTNCVIDKVNHLVNVSISLDADSHLGAGDFTLCFDKTLFTYVGYEKKFSPTFFTVNDKEQQLNEGRVKFSILSTTDIINSTDVIVFTFSYLESTQSFYSHVLLEGSGLTDSLTNPIELNVLGTYILFEGTDIIIAWGNQYLFMNDESFAGDGTGRCLSEGLYITAKRELLKLDVQDIDAFANDVDGKYTSILARYLAWASACGDTTPFNGDGIVPSNIFNNNNYSNGSPVFLCVVLVLISGPFVLIYLIKKTKRKHK